jgi:LAO/AO transport system kinase
MKPFFVYVLKCADGSYYTGHTDELDRRIGQHHAGEMPGYTHDKRPVELVWSQETAGRDEALAAELQIKGWSRAKKEALIAGDWARVSELAKSRKGLASTGSARSEIQAQPERSKPVRPELVEGFVPREQVLRQAQDERVGLAQRVLHRDRRALAKAITLIESTRADHRAQADALLDALMPNTGQSLRIGISGVPGVGKSTFIETLGLHLIAQGRRVAVLAVDPSSTLSGGSILGDKTRMERLSVRDAAFIRPTPTSGALGGVAEHTREALLLCEAAGFDVVVVETVGVGQSETAVAGMTDLFVLLQLPNAGDDLQAIKRGVMELADLVAINKADLDDVAAIRAQAQITSALRVFGFHGRAGHHAVPVLKVSAIKGDGIEAFWQTVQTEIAQRRTSGAFDARRRAQREAWLWDIVQARLLIDFKQHAAVREALAQTLADVNASRTAPTVAARELLNLFEKN